MVRLMLLEVAQNRRRPLLLAARVPCNLEGCRQDGFDIAMWARENLVDILTLGSRSIDCDIDEFRRVTRGRNIKLQPCHDDHLATDAYQYAIEAGSVRRIRSWTRCKTWKILITG